MKTTIDGYEIHYKITGDAGRKAVILQGWGTELAVYDSVAASINDQYTVVQLDLPGFGGSDEPREPWDVDAYADFFCSFLKALELDAVTLIGHSYGGRVIIKLAARKELPFTLRSIVLIDSAGVLPVRTFRQKMKIRSYKILKRIFSVRLIYILFPEVVDEWRSRQGSADYKNASPMMRQCMVMAVNEDLTPLLKEIRQDTLLIWGDQDTATPIRDAKIMEREIPGAGLAVLHGAGHFSFLEQPAVFANVMRAFLVNDNDSNERPA